MSNRTVKFVSAILTSIITASNFSAVTDIGAHAAAETCLSGPKGTAPAGGHWYYRIDRETKRHCWYVGDLKQKGARTATQEPEMPANTPAPETNPAPAQQDAGIRPSVADAHAELPSPSMRAGQDAGGSAPQRVTAPPSEAQPSAVTSRWPDVSSVVPAGNLRTATVVPPVAPQAVPDNAPQPAANPISVTTVDSTTAKPPGSTQMLFVVALAGVIGAVVVRFGRARAMPDCDGERRSIWEPVDGPRSPSAPRNAGVPMWQEQATPWRNDAPQDQRAADDPDRRITQMLSRLARSAQS